MEGIFQEFDENPMNGVSIAFVRTCSNDAFMGNNGPSPKTQINGRMWQFRGTSIIEAVFHHLRVHHGLGNNSKQRIIYGGCSSGARGVLMSMDHVADHYVGQASLVGLVDSPIWL